MTAYILEKWEGWMAHAIYPSASIIKADVSDTVDEFINKINDTEVFFHIAFTYPKHFLNDRDKLIKSLEDKNIKAYNINVTDNSKRFLESFLMTSELNNPFVTKDGNPDESVIVKSNFNNFGIRDVEISKLHPNWSLPCPREKRMKYYIKTRKDISDKEWDNPEYVIQKYITNKNNVTYRGVYHRGKSIVFVDNSNIIIKKLTSTDEWHVSSTQETSKIFDILKILSNKLKFDFFTIDVVKDNADNFFVIDLNTTPAWSIKNDYNIIKNLCI